jgi:hypothetical protein
MRSEDLKKRIEEVEVQLLQAQEQAENLPVQAGQAAAAGDEKKADDLFSQAEKAILLIRRYSATLKALQEQFAESKKAEKAALVEQRQSVVEREAEEIQKTLDKKIQTFAEAWNSILEIKPNAVEIQSLSGSNFLKRFFADNKSILGGTGYEGGEIPASEIHPDRLKGYLSNMVNGNINAAFRLINETAELGMLRG